MKIGIFTDSYLPYTSGVVRSIQTFKEELLLQGHEVYIFAPSYKNCSYDNRIFRFASFPSLTNPEFSIAVPFSFRLKQMIIDLRLDLIHVHSPFLLGRLGAKHARKAGIPLVFTFHTLYEQYIHYVPFVKSITRELTQKISRDFCNQSDMVIVPTNVIGDYLKNLGVTSPICKVPTGIKVHDYQNGDMHWLRKHFNIPEEDKILVFVGRLGQEKNISFLLDSFKSVNEQISNTTLVLVGGGPEKEELKNSVDMMGIGNKVLFVGTLLPHDVINCYASSDIFVFPSVTETQGIVIIEAKAAGLPVVAVGAYGVLEMVEKGVDGFLTKLDVTCFTQKIIQLLVDDDLRQNMGIKAKENAKSFSSTRCTERLVECYEGLLQEKNQAYRT